MNGRAQYLSGTSDNLTGPTFGLAAFGLVITGASADGTIGFWGTTIVPIGGIGGTIGPKGATGAVSGSEGTNTLAGDRKSELGGAGVNIPDSRARQQVEKKRLEIANFWHSIDRDFCLLPKIKLLPSCRRPPRLQSIHQILEGFFPLTGL